jgi:hypothetical protein
MQMNTYVLARPYPAGLSVTDAITISGNKRRPIRFERQGDAIDLMAVDVETFARSAYVGIIRHLFLTGMLMAVPVEVPEPRASLITEAFQKLQENGGNASGLIGSPTMIQLEPGVQIGVMGIPDMANKLPEGLPISPVETNSRELEPGVMVPGGSGQMEPPQVVASEESSAPKGKKGKKSKKDPAGQAKAEAAPGYENWKVNVDFQTQKSRVAESTDKDFLTWVSTKDESRQLQKIASARLAELEKA